MTLTASGMTLQGHAVGLTVHERERHGETMIHVHLVHDGEIELIQDQRLRQVRCELWMPLNDRHWSRPPALIGGLKLRRTAKRERGNQLERECGRVIVVDEDDHIDLLLGNPLLGEFKTLEYRLPIGFVGLAQVDGSADRRYMRSRQS